MLFYLAFKTLIGKCYKIIWFLKFVMVFSVPHLNGRSEKEKKLQGLKLARFPRLKSGSVWYSLVASFFKEK